MDSGASLLSGDADATEGEDEKMSDQRDIPTPLALRKVSNFFLAPGIVNIAVASHKQTLRVRRCNPPPGVPGRPRIARSDQRAGRDHCIVYRSTGKPIVFGTQTFLRSHSLPGNLVLPLGDQRVRAPGREPGDPPQFGSRDGHREFFILVVQQHDAALGQVVVRQQQHQCRGE